MASAASTGTPASRACTPGGGSSARRMVSMTCSCFSSGINRMPKASVAVLRSRVMTPWEKYGGTASSRPSMSVRLAAAPPENRSGSENAGTGPPGRSRGPRGTRSA